jgi:hypothetical protein
MSEPLKPLTPDLKALLQVEAGTDGPPSGAQERVYSRIETTLGIVGAVSLGASATASAAKASGAAATAAAAAKGSAPFLATIAGKILIATLATTTAVGVGVGVKRALSPAKPVAAVVEPVVASPTPGPAAQVAASAVNTPDEEEGVSAEPAKAAPVTTTKKRIKMRERVETADGAIVVTGDLPATLAQERVLLEHARAALMENEPGVALDLLNRHQQRFPDAQLSEERESLAIRALIQSGKRPEAEARFARFRRDYPESIFLRAVSDLLRAK